MIESSTTTTPRRARRSGRTRTTLAALIAAVALIATGCTGGAGDRDDFVDILTRDDGFTEAESECIADAVFERYAEDGDALDRISGAEDWEFLTGENGVEGFDEFFTEVVETCTTVGPTPGS